MAVRVMDRLTGVRWCVVAVHSPCNLVTIGTRYRSRRHRLRCHAPLRAWRRHLLSCRCMQIWGAQIFCSLAKGFARVRLPRLQNKFRLFYERSMHSKTIIASVERLTAFLLAVLIIDLAKKDPGEVIRGTRMQNNVTELSKGNIMVLERRRSGYLAFGVGDKELRF